MYHLDTGIRFSHSEFGFIDGSPGSRARPGFSVFGDDNATDCFGHGTHTAATIGGKPTVQSFPTTYSALRTDNAAECFRHGINTAATIGDKRVMHSFVTPYHASSCDNAAECLSMAPRQLPLRAVGVSCIHCQSAQCSRL